MIGLRIKNACTLNARRPWKKSGGQARGGGGGGSHHSKGTKKRKTENCRLGTHFLTPAEDEDKEKTPSFEGSEAGRLCLTAHSGTRRSKIREVGGFSPLSLKSRGGCLPKGGEG